MGWGLTLAVHSRAARARGLIVKARATTWHWDVAVAYSRIRPPQRAIPARFDTQVEAQQEKSQRRDRAAIVADVRAALVRVLEKKPFNDVTVDELAREAGLSRTAFYFYYKDKHEVLRAVLEDLSETAHDQASAWWSGEGPPEAMIRKSLRDVGSLWDTHGGILRATVEVSAYDPAFMNFYQGLMNGFIGATQAHLHNERAAGKLRAGTDSARQAEALVWMGERCHYVGLLEGRPSDETADVLTGIWLHALYPDEGIQA
jgi:TetR/AcrR family transcriptional regulator, ethionamide resistance regulator